MDGLSAHLKSRLVDLSRAKADGRKIIGYTPGGYMPEELVLACKGIPVCMIRGGDHSAVEMAGAYICRWLDSFCRNQIGYAVSKADPYYSIIDLLVIPITDNHIRAISDIVDYHTDIDVFPFGVPHMKEDTTFKYYLHGLTRLKAKLEEFTGEEITDSRLEEAISLCNRERQLLREISLMRKSQPAPISFRDFVELNHASLVGDKKVVVNMLESVRDELKTRKEAAPPGAPRILLTGSTLAMGDSRLIDLVEGAGGSIVIEEFAEGISPYWEDVVPGGDLLESLADCYFRRRVPPAWFRPAKERLDFIIKLAREFNVDGVIWYQLMYRESYKLESYYFPERLKKETGLPILIVESDYDPSETGPMRTRVEAFMETFRR